MKKNSLISIWSFLSISLLVLLVANTSKAQIVSGNAFLKGNFVEVGISPCGKFGSEVATPAGYHANMPGSTLGFVADAAGDGWGVGTPNFCGDYFLPGSPEEGFGVSANGIDYGNFADCAAPDITGAITSYTVSATDQTAVWTGNVAGAGLAITSTTKVPLTGKYFITSIQICNTSAVTVNNVYYMRNVDPDNEQIATGDFDTQNTIVFQQPTSAQCRALVNATGTTYGCYLGIGSKDPRARVSYGGFSNRNAADIWAFAAGYTGTIGSTNLADEAISISFNIGSLAPGECQTVSFAYILNAADLDAALDATANPQYFADGSDISTTGTASACAGSPIGLSISNGGSFTWTWSPATFLNTTTGASVICTPSSNMVYTVTGTSACSPTVTRTITVNIVSPPVINTQPASQTVCAGTPVTLSVGATNPSGGGLTYQWQYNGSNIAGATSSTYNIASPTVANSGNYTVIVRGGCPLTSSVAVLTVNATAPAAVGITATPSSTVCAGTSITFTANPTNGGATPAYQWYLNGTMIPGATGATYSSASLVTGNLITVQMTSSTGCATPAVATSSATFVTSVNVSNALSASSTAICAGTNVTFTADPLNTNPAGTLYTFYVNGVAVSGPSVTKTYTTNTLTNGNAVTVSMSSPAGGTTTFSAGPVSIPSSGTSTPYPSAINVTGLSGTITDVKVRFTNITHTWISDIDILLKAPTGAQSTVFSDAVGSNDFISPNSITYQTGGGAMPTTDITGTQVYAPFDDGFGTDDYPAPGPGTVTVPANFGVFNSLAPNGIWNLYVVDDVGGDSGNIPTWELIITTSGIVCSATSSPIVMAVGGGTASVSISTPTPNICTGSTVNFTAVPVNGGLPTYQWQVNGVNVVGATSSTFSSATLANNDTVRVIMTSSLGGCVVGSPAISNIIVMGVSPLPVVTFTLPATICKTNAGIDLAPLATPAGGTFSGLGVSGTMFSPGIVPVGPRTLTYTYTTGSCTVIRTATILVEACAFPPPLPPVAMPAYLIVEGQDTRKLRLRFPDADNNETGYEIYRSTNGTDFVLHVTTGAYNVTEIHYFDSTATLPDRPYYYIVRTIQGTRRSGFTNSAYDYTYPLAPTISAITNACMNASGTIKATAPHESQEFRWYTASDAQLPIYEAGSEPYRSSVLTTPMINATTTFWVTAKGFKYESKPRVSATVSVRTRPVAKLLDVTPRILSCENSYTFKAEFYAGMTYTWYRDGVVVGTSSTTNEFVANRAGEYRVSVSDGFCDSYSEWVSISLNYKPEAKIREGITPIFCSTGILTAKPIKNATYSWSKDGVVLGTDERLTVSEAGIYTLTVTQFGCSNSTQTTVSINKIPSTFAIDAASPSICPNGETTLTVTALPTAIRYVWYLNGRAVRFTTANTLKVKKAGNYTVRVYFSEECSEISTASVDVELLDAPKVVIGITTDAKISISNALGLTFSSVKWFVDGEEIISLANQTSFTPTKNGNYQAFVSYPTGCEVVSGSIYYGINGTDEAENPNQVKFLLYPNPSKGDLFLTLNTKENVSVNILDQLGRELITKQFTAEEVQRTAKMDLSALPSGIYMVKITVAGISTIRKITRD